MTQPDPAFALTRKIEGILPVSGTSVPPADLLAFAQAAVDHGAKVVTVNRNDKGVIVGVAFSVEVPV